MGADAEVVIHDQEGRALSPIKVVFELLIDVELRTDDLSVGRLLVLERRFPSDYERVSGFVMRQVVLL